MDVTGHLNAVGRSVSSLERDGRAARAVTVQRSFATTVADLWDAVTNAERIPRWFLPVSGTLELGGRYQLEGNAGGTVSACEPPSHCAFTWEFGGDTSWVEVRLSEDGDGTVQLVLSHTMHLSEHWDTYGPGATGVGWELGMLGLARHVARPDGPPIDEAAFAASPEGQEFLTGSSVQWGQAAVAAGAAPVEAAAAAQRTAAFYRGEAPEGA